MPTVTILPQQKTIDIPAGTELLAALRQAQLPIESPCGGKGSCGKCIVQIMAGAVDSDSLGLLTEAAVAAGYVLACKTKLTASPITVRIDEHFGSEGSKFLEDTHDLELIPPAVLPRPEQIQPRISKINLTVDPPQLEGGLADIDRIHRKLPDAGVGPSATYPLAVLQLTADALRQAHGQVTLTVEPRHGKSHVLDIEAGAQENRNYGLAVDVGTTTVAVQLVHLPTGKIVGTKSAYNDQIECGLDIISRINYARRPERAAELRDRILNTINRLIEQLCQNHQIKPRSIYQGVIAGNTTMFHLLLGLKPEYLRLEPYTPTVHEIPELRAAEVGLEMNPNARLFFTPCVGSYVGGDITAGLLCTTLATATEALHLLIDVGTNGELVIGNQDFLMTCACSAGPAFEGGGIRQGMRATIGAIDQVMVDPITGIGQYRTIGNSPPRGICGSGMISLLASLFRTGWIDAAGKLNRQKSSAAIQMNGRFGEYVVAPAEKAKNRKPIAISENEIENVIRAKAAIYSAISLILEQVGLALTDLETIFIAGGFGRHLDLENAITIGLLPDLAREKFQYIGNSSLMGAYMTLVSPEHRQRLMELARKMTYIELNTNPNYMDQYTGALFLPHTDRTRFPSIP
ncbi:ASKHA domain-containing protein [candidate division KSB1 bacterium]|nr:ASKHA domain-containing protein [candidate division KSB1 bacterium]